MSARAKYSPTAVSTAAPPAITAVDPSCATSAAASSTPMDWPMKRKDANSDTAVPRACGAIWVALVCMVLWNMKKPKPASRLAGTLGHQTGVPAMTSAEPPSSSTPVRARPCSPRRGIRKRATAI